jgi:hypothetical protein
VLYLDNRATPMGGGGLLGELSCVECHVLTDVQPVHPVRIEPGSDVGSSVAK